MTTTSASSSSPEVSRRPVSVKVSTVSVTIEDVPALSDRNRSPSGTKQSRWSHGLYVGLKCVSTSTCSGSWASVALRIRARSTPGRRRLSW